MTIRNAICIHEEDYGILWKHVDLNTFTTEVRRSRRLVVSSIHTVGNYEYGFYWYFYLDGTHPARGEAHRHPPDDGRGRRRATRSTPASSRPAWRRRTTSTCSASASTSTSTAPTTRCTRPSSSRRHRRGRRTRYGNAFVSRDAAREGVRGAARRRRRTAPLVDGASSAEHTNALGRPTAYRLLPGHAADVARRRGLGRSPSGLRSPATTCGSRRTTRTSAGPPGTTRTCHPGGAGLPRGPRPTAPLDGHRRRRSGTRSASTTCPGPEDWPVMPVEYVGVHAQPVRVLRPQPGADRPPSAGHHC